MFARNVFVHLKSNLLSGDTQTVGEDILLPLPKQNVFRKLIIGGMLMGLLTGMCFAQRATQRPAPSATPAPNANPVAPNTPTAAPNVPTAAPNVPTTAPNTPTVAPDAPTVAPNANPVNPDSIPVVPNANPVNPGDTTQAPSGLQP
ncbi:MAG: hypothetical protein WA655_16540 [Candidatus Korobacteraceae bacterium]